ncbi:hypothetical protein CWO90_30390 [Bradyrhizobium sp. Leo121]|nr:hypothetical protein CWO90_30390 [Bradyrhizobium sp. Leo121]
MSYVLFVELNGDGMRRSTVPRLAVTKSCFRAGNLNDAPAQTVCVALALAVITLAWRIAAVW